jgi:hypothetical protein
MSALDGEGVLTVFSPDERRISCLTFVSLTSKHDKHDKQSGNERSHTSPGRVSCLTQKPARTGLGAVVVARSMQGRHRALVTFRKTFIVAQNHLQQSTSIDQGSQPHYIPDSVRNGGEARAAL